jgi:hypothetical protein
LEVSVVRAHSNEELDAGFDEEELTAAAAGEVAPANW